MQKKLKNHVHRDPVLCLMNSLREYHCLCIGFEQESPNGNNDSCAIQFCLVPAAAALYLLIALFIL